MYVCILGWYVRIWNFDAKQSMHFLVDITFFITISFTIFDVKYFGKYLFFTLPNLAPCCCKLILTYQLMEKIN
jgi:hypothetical protein